MKTKSVLFFLLLLTNSAFLSAEAQAPEFINYQGRVINNGSLVNEQGSVVFRLFTVPDGGTAVYAETQRMAIVDGLYSVRIGASNATPGVLSSALTNSPVYLEVEIDGTVLLPRERLGSVAYALTAVSKSGDTMTGPLSINVGANKDLVISNAGHCVMIGNNAIAYDYGVAIGYHATGGWRGVAIGELARATNDSVAIGYMADGSLDGMAIGYTADARSRGAALGWGAKARSYGTAIGRETDASTNGVAIGFQATGTLYGAAIGYKAMARNNGVAVGNQANGAGAAIAIGDSANAAGGSDRIAIGRSVVNSVDNSVRLRGELYLDGTSNIHYRSTFGSGEFQAKTFVIDHPLDPEHKILRHACVEGPVVQNLYDGVTALDANGEAVIQLPDYFDALNINPRYVLTAIGAPMPNLHVKEKIQGSRFTVSGGAPGGEVSWVVLGERNDRALKENPLVVEEPKAEPGLIYQQRQ